jgi:hypothetical protein
MGDRSEGWLLTVLGAAMLVLLLVVRPQQPTPGTGAVPAFPHSSHHVGSPAPRLEPHHVSRASWLALLVVMSYATLRGLIILTIGLPVTPPHVARRKLLARSEPGRCVGHRDWLLYNCHLLASC